jgi:putative ABC transport system permease protein
MIAVEVGKTALAALRTNKLRSFLNALGIIIAVTTILVVISIISGLNKYASDLINQLGPNTFIVSKFGVITSRAQFLDAAKRKDYDESDVEAVRRLVPEALRVSGRIFSTHSVYAEGRRMPDTFILGTGPEFPFMVGMELEDGRYFTDAESRASRNVAIIGFDVRDQVFPHVDPIGRTITVEGRPFTVIGVLVRQGKAFGQSQDQVAIVPLTCYRKLYGKNSTVDIFVEAPDQASRPAVEDAVRAVLRARRKTPFDQPDPFDIVTAESLAVFWKQITFAAFLLVVWVSSISLAVGGVAIANTMFASVMERTREIGIRKALGARRGDLMLQFLIEAVALTFVGGLIGILIGWGISAVIASATPIPARVTPMLVATGLSVATLSGLLAGWLPALRAARMDPIVALREE